MSTPKITISMSEVVRYSRTFSVEELAEVLDVEPTLDAVHAAIDLGNSTYGTTDDDESLLAALIPQDDPYRWLADIEDREWGLRHVSPR